MKHKSGRENEHFVVSRSHVARTSNNVLLFGSIVTVGSSAGFAYPLSPDSLVSSGLIGAIGIFITALVWWQLTSFLSQFRLLVTKDSILFTRGREHEWFYLCSVDSVNVYRAKEGGLVERIVLSGPAGSKTIVGYEDQEVLLARILERVPSHTVSVGHETEDGSKKKWALLLALTVVACQLLAHSCSTRALAAILVAGLVASIFVVLAMRSADRSTRREAVLFFFGFMLLSTSALASIWVLSKLRIGL